MTAHTISKASPMPEATIRTAVAADAPDIVRVLRASIAQLCTADHGDREAPLGQWLANKTVPNVETWIANPANIMLVAEADGAIASVGCLRTDGHILLNYVAPERRFRGVSKAMLVALERHARALNLGAVSLESTKTALPFYKAAGYEEVGAPVTKHDLPTWPMVKRLNPESGS